MPESPSPKSRLASWSLLVLPFVALLVTAFGNERANWPDLLPREATILMQAGSLVEDHDLLYTRLDFDRLLLAWRGNPPDLELATGGDGRRITFHYPPVYALYLAPFLALAPERGIALANVLLLLAASLLAARALETRLGFWGPALVALWIFGSVAFAGVFRGDGDCFSLSLVLLAVAAWLRADNAGKRTGRLALAAGALLSPVILILAPALLLLPLFLLVATAERRRQLAPQFLLGAGLGLLLLVLVAWWNGGGLYFAATSSFKFTPATGYPAVDFPPTAWTDEVKKLAALHWDGAPRLSWGFEPRLMAWNLLYFSAGSQLGLLPYFLPLLLAFAAPRARPLLLLGGVWILWLLWLHPFNFWGGPGPLGNRALLPLYGAALLVLPGWRQRLAEAGKRALVVAAMFLVVTAPFLFELWRSPEVWPYDKAVYTQQSASARRLLPLEVSQRWLPGGVVEELGGVFIAALDENTWVEKRNARLGLAGDKAAFLVCSSQALSSLLLEMDKGAPNEIQIRGGRQGDRILRGDGGIGFRVEPELWRRHALYFSPLPMFIYRLELELPPGRTGDTFFRIAPEWPSGEEK